MVEIDEDAEPLDFGQVFLELPVPFLRLAAGCFPFAVPSGGGDGAAEQAFAEAFVVRGGDVDESHAALAQALHGGDDVGAAEGDVLHAGAGVEGDELLDAGTCAGPARVR